MPFHEIHESKGACGKRVEDLQGKDHQKASANVGSRSEVRSREALMQPVSLEAQLIENLKEERARLQTALSDPTQDYDLLVIGVHQESLEVARGIVESYRGKYFHPDKEVLVVAPERGRGAARTPCRP